MPCEDNPTLLDHPNSGVQTFAPNCSALSPTSAACLNQRSATGALCEKSCGLCQLNSTMTRSAFDYMTTQDGMKLRYEEGGVEGLYPTRWSSVPLGNYQLSMADGNTSAHPVSDGSSGTPETGCQPYMTNHSGKVVLIERGICWFSTKVSPVSRGVSYYDQHHMAGTLCPKGWCCGCGDLNYLLFAIVARC